MMIHDINDRFENFAGNLHVLHKFKISFEAMIIAVVDAPDIDALENFVESLWDLGSIDIHSEPILHYETFARNIGVAEELINLPEPKLRKDNLYWVELVSEYYGKTTAEFAGIVKREGEFVLRYRARENVGLALYKSVAQGKMQVFINQPSAGELDSLTFQLPIVRENGANVHIKPKGIQFLEEYIKQHPLPKPKY
ncbi:hypothetical protein BsWGS_10336 [Bradybaena similaris]